MHFLLALLLRFLSLYAGLLLSLGTMSVLGQRTASFLYRTLLSWTLLLLCATYGVLAALTMRLFGAHYSSQWAAGRAFALAMRLLAGVRFDVLGPADASPLTTTRPAVFVANHQTALDVLLLGTVFPRRCSVTAKRSLRRVPFLGAFMALSGTVFVDRSAAGRAAAREAFADAARTMRRERQSVFIFPEGTRSNACEPTLLPFKKGAFHLAIEAGAPIVPIVSACYWGVLGIREWRFRKGRIPVVVLPPIPTDNLDASDVDQLCAYTREHMLKALVRLTDSGRGQQAFLVDPSPPMALERPATEEESTSESVSKESAAVDGVVSGNEPAEFRKRTGAKEGVREEGLGDGVAT